MLPEEPLELAEALLVLPVPNAPVLPVPEVAPAAVAPVLVVDPELVLVAPVLLVALAETAEDEAVLSLDGPVLLELVAEEEPVEPEPATVPEEPAPDALPVVAEALPELAEVALPELPGPEVVTLELPEVAWPPVPVPPLGAGLGQPVSQTNRRTAANRRAIFPPDVQEPTGPSGAPVGAPPAGSGW